MTKSKVTKGTAEKSSKRASISTVTPTLCVAKELSTTIANEVQTTKKNPKTVTKWLNKLKTSVLKKVSIVNKKVFPPKSDVDGLKRQYEELEKKLQKQINNIKQKAIQMSQRKNTPARPAQLDDKVLREVDARGAQLSERYSTIARELGMMRKNISARSDALANTLVVVEKNMQEQGIIFASLSPLKPVPLKAAESSKNGFRNILNKYP